MILTLLARSRRAIPATFLLAFAVVFAACASEPAPTPVPATGAPAPTLQPTYTPLPTYTLYPTPTDVPTPTSTATPTPTPAPTPTQTPTPMPTPTPTPRPTSTPRPTTPPLPLAQYQGIEKLVAALTVYVETPTGTGSGFFYDLSKAGQPRDYAVITNAHLVEDHAYVDVCWAVTQKCVSGRVTARSADDDIAVIEHATFTLDVITLSVILDGAGFGWGGSWDAGDVVYASGYPGGNTARGRTVVSDPVVTEGIITNDRMVRYAGGYFIEHGADIGPGSSGGPLIKNDGYIVGMNVGYNTEAERLEIAVPVGLVLDWLDALNAPTPTPWPTATPRPTATPGPTPTPWPTATPRPTATLTPLPDSCSRGPLPGWSMMLIRKFNEYCNQVRATARPTPIAEPTPVSGGLDLSSSTTASLYVYLAMIQYSWNPSEWINAEAKSASFIDTHELTVEVRFGRQYDRYRNSEPMLKGRTYTLSEGGRGPSLDAVTGIVASTSEGVMRCQEHQTSTFSKLVYACDFR